MGPTYPVRTGPTGWLADDGLLGLLFIHFVPMPIYSVPRVMFRVSKDICEIFESFSPSTTPLEIKAS